LNLYAYCGNNPVAYTDPTGLWIETVFDLFSLGVSVVEVVINPANLWNWAGLVGDAVDLLPLVTGVGEGVKSTKLVKYTDSMYDTSLKTIRISKAVNHATDFADGSWNLVRTVDRTADGFTASNHLLGTRLHTFFMNNGVTIKGTRLRVDGLIENNIFELKPYNRRSLRAGVKQLLQYNNAFGGKHNMILVFY